MKNSHEKLIYRCITGVLAVFCLTIALAPIALAQKGGAEKVRRIYGDRAVGKKVIKSAGSADGYILYDDMYLPESAVKSASPIRAQRWPNGILPITFHTNVTADQRNKFFIACAWWGRGANITCQARTNERDYIVVVASNTSSSYVGRIGGGQLLKLDRWDAPGTIAHEVGHALGLAHEHMRLDRDNFVKIDYTNIDSNWYHNFDRIDAEIFSRYDYDSIMHYSDKAFSNSGQLTIVALDPPSAVNMGQRNFLSRRDELAAYKMYGPRNGGPTINTPNIIGQTLAGAISLLRHDYGLSINVTSGPTQFQLIKWTICESESRTPVIATQVPPAPDKIQVGSSINVTTRMEVEHHFYRPPPGRICE